MKIIKRRERVESVSHSRSFEYEDMPGAGFGFDCDEDGNLNVEALNPCARKSYEACIAGAIEVLKDAKYEHDSEGDLRPVPGTGRKEVVKLIDKGVVTRRHSYIQPAVGICDHCKREVELHGFTNTCACGADYNMSGQRLADRSQWGEETGESVSDILMADSHPFED